MTPRQTTAANADLLLVVLDATQEIPVWPAEISAQIQSYKALGILNKIDLVEAARAEKIFSGLPLVGTSVLTGAGWDELLRAIGQKADSFQREAGNDSIAINARHAHALSVARVCLSEAQSKLASGAPSELLASDLRGVLDAYGEISGKVDNEQMLDRLFGIFCIGK